MKQKTITVAIDETETQLGEKNYCMCSAVCGYLLIQAFFQALQSYSWGFAMIQYFRNTVRGESRIGRLPEDHVQLLQQQ